MSVVDNAVYVDGRRAEEPESLDRTVETLQRCEDGKATFCWIGMLRPGPDDIAAIEDEFGLHELAVEDTLHGHQRPKLERYGQTEFAVLRPARYVDEEEEVELGEIHLFLGPEFVVTVRHAEEPDLAAVRRRLEDDPELLAHGPFAVFYAVLDKVVDDYGPVLDGLQNDVDQIEDQVWNADPAVSRRIYKLTREVIEFQRAVDPLVEIFDELRTRFGKQSTTPDLELRRLMRDVQDHATRVRERTQGLRDLLANILTVNSTLVAQRQNEEMTRLTEAGYVQNEQMKKVSSWAAIAFAPSLVAGIYGMNFTHMPELEWSYGYPFAFGLMLLLGLLLYLGFKRRGWL
ncbi:magnesium and cobalt transport protein CorA [Pseudonocardia kujensis]|uniref:magnesium and cobalt transport protein CorA n=1 Tax=Pseudonocardia kujensis TaxID=1128675 RepID=UPI001E371414|nr:magnesium and cobalt transport protein CorA [Pseudonocardia kujensis]MCE0763944.1 magnesium and cobalt transport protein CorA [Pseudonocardia kujensis]